MPFCAKTPILVRSNAARTIILSEYVGFVFFIGFTRYIFTIQYTIIAWKEYYMQFKFNMLSSPINTRLETAKFGKNNRFAKKTASPPVKKSLREG